MTVYLVCEGHRQGLDDRVLDALVIQFHRLQVLIEPAGGSKGHRAVRTYLESRSRHNVGIAVEDRDYLPRTEANATWANQAGRSFVWRRHEIENYLLHPHVVLELFNDFRAAGFDWASSLPATEADTEILLQALAGPLLEEHAAQVLKDELVRQINAIGGLSFGPSVPAPLAAAHVPGQGQWLPVLRQEATRLWQTCTGVAAWQGLQPAEIATRYSGLVAQFQLAAFLQSADYLIDMKGKDLLAALSRHLTGFGAPAKLTQEALADELLRMVKRIYRPDSLYQPDDFAELAAILGQY